MPPANQRPILLAATLLLIAGAVVYSNAFSDVFVGYNAARSIRDNEDIRQLWPLWRSMSLHLTGQRALADGGTFVRRPLLSLSFALNQALLGNQPWAYELVNIIIHIGAALLLFGLVRRTLQLPTLRGRLAFGPTGVATTVALLWLVHPLQTQSVTYFVQRAESLMGLFFLLTLYASARAFVDGGRGWQVAAWIACAAGMGTKEVMVAAPVVVYLYDATLVSGSLSAPLYRRAGFYAALAATWWIPAVLIAATMADVKVDFEPERTLPYLLSQPGVILHYLQLSFWPSPLYVYVNTQLFMVDPQVTPMWRIALPAAAIIALSVASIWGVWRRRWWGFLGAAFFLILAPTCTFVATNDVVQEHRMYLPLAAVVILAVVGGGMLLGRVVEPWRQRLALALVGTIALGLGWTSWHRNADYHSEMAVYHPSDLSMAHGILARYAFLRGDVDDAEARYRAALELPLDAFGVGDPAGRFHRARVHNDLGNLLVSRGALPEAEEQFAKAIALRPSFAPAQNNLAALAFLRGDIAVARRHLQDAIRLEPKEAAPHGNLGVLFATHGKPKEAAQQLEQAQQLAPYQELARKNLAAMRRLRPPNEAPIIEAVASPGLADAWVALRMRAPE